MKTISERFTYLLEKEGLSMYQLSERTGITQSTLGRIRNQNAKPNKANRKILADFFGVESDWLIYGESKNVRAINNLISDDFDIKFHDGTRYIILPSGKMVAMIPFVDKSRVPSYTTNPEVLSHLPFYPIYTAEYLSKNLLAFRVLDNSMESSIKKDDVIIASEIDKKMWRMSPLYNSTQYFVIVSNGLILIRSIQYTDEDDFIVVKALNESYPDSKISLNLVDKLFRVEQKSISY